MSLAPDVLDVLLGAGVHPTLAAAAGAEPADLGLEGYGPGPLPSFEYPETAMPPEPSTAQAIGLALGSYRPDAGRAYESPFAAGVRGFSEGLAGGLSSGAQREREREDRAAQVTNRRNMAQAQRNWQMATGSYLVRERARLRTQAAEDARKAAAEARDAELVPTPARMRAETGLDRASRETIATYMRPPAPRPSPAPRAPRPAKEDTATMVRRQLRAGLGITTRAAALEWLDEDMADGSNRTNREYLVGKYGPTFVPIMLNGFGAGAAQ